MDLDLLLADLDPDQRAAVLSDGGPLCIVAPAGSGKTRVLTRRIARRLADGSADAGHVLVITFTRRAAGELTRRLSTLGPRDAVAAGTFHGLAYRLLRQRWQDQRRRAPDLAPSRLRLVEEVLTERNRAPIRGVALEMTAEIDWARAQRAAPEAYCRAATAAGRRTHAAPAQVADVFARYEHLKNQRRLVDFDDLLSLARTEVERDAAYAAAIRWRFRHLFVDEFQDVNPLQHALLEAWRGGRADLCVVGDPHQAIYGWNGADGRWLESFAEHHPGATILRLRHSHRSSPQIVAFGHAILTGAADGAPQVTRPDGTAPRLVRFADAPSEARGVAAMVRDARPPGGRWRSIAVLARTNAQLEPVADALSRAGIPARRRGRPSEDPIVAAALAELRSVTGPGSLRSWLEETLADEPADTEHEDGAGAVLPAPFVRAVEDLLAQEPAADGPALRTWLSTGGGGDGLASGEDAVALLSFHAAKGLEWPTVVVIGAVAGVVPHSSARTSAARAEERRLFHVAVTRAERELIITCYGSQPSSFVDALETSVEPAIPPPAELRPLAVPPTVDPVLAALRAWRRDAARAARIEETAVVEDRTLAAIAAARPDSIEALAEVTGFGPLMARRHGPRLLAAIAPALALAGPPAPDRRRS
ncbi:MAG TPA: ATP-dependent helicase [Acidimicrobiales bacterium]|nr:ATP-dependent helicase [Acidimicrobiales bacterium]